VVANTWQGRGKAKTNGRRGERGALERVAVAVTRMRFPDRVCGIPFRCCGSRSRRPANKCRELRSCSPSIGVEPSHAGQATQAKHKPNTSQTQAKKSWQIAAGDPEELSQRHTHEVCATRPSGWCSEGADERGGYVGGLFCLLAYLMGFRVFLGAVCCSRERASRRASERFFLTHSPLERCTRASKQVSCCFLFRIEPMVITKNHQT